MTLQDVLLELIEHLGQRRETLLGWDQTRQWPEGAVDIFQQAGWLKPTPRASVVECPGCEESCSMSVHVSPGQTSQKCRAYIACDKRPDMGRVPVPLHFLDQWQLTDIAVATWLCRMLDVASKPLARERDGDIVLGSLMGTERRAKLKLRTTPSAGVAVSGHTIGLDEVLAISHGHITLHRDEVIRLIELPRLSESGSDLSKQETRKLGTQALHGSWRRTYAEMKRLHPDKNDSWIARQIAKSETAKGRSTDTIRKNMKK